uniref:Uncharacterized protein n=1 Tax=viral metagenome TaxID=1070528 RepID=A0A6C0J6Z5_9ZZZZ
MDLSLLKNFQTLIGSSLNSIIEDTVVQFDNIREELTENIEILKNENLELSNKVKELNDKLEEHQFTEENFNKVSIISNLNKQLKESRNENSDLRNYLSKNIPLNPSLVKKNSLSRLVKDDNVKAEEDVLEEDVLEEVLEDALEEVREDALEDAREDALEDALEDAEDAEDVVEDAREDVEEIHIKGKNYYLIDNKLYKIKNGVKGKCVGKMVDGEPILNKNKNKNKN